MRVSSFAQNHYLSQRKIGHFLISNTSSKGKIYSAKGYMLLSRRGRDTIRRKRAPFSHCGENSDQLNATRLCVQAPMSRLVCCSTFVLLASKTNHALDVPCHRKHIIPFDLICLVSEILHHRYVAGEGCGVAGDIYYFS